MLPFRRPNQCFRRHPFHRHHMAFPTSNSNEKLRRSSAISGCFPIVLAQVSGDLLSNRSLPSAGVIPGRCIQISGDLRCCRESFADSFCDEPCCLSGDQHFFSCKAFSCPFSLSSWNNGTNTMCMYAMPLSPCPIVKSLGCFSVVFIFPVLFSMLSGQLHRHRSPSPWWQVLVVNYMVLCCR